MGNQPGNITHCLCSVTVHSTVSPACTVVWLTMRYIAVLVSFDLEAATWCWIGVLSAKSLWGFLNSHHISCHFSARLSRCGLRQRQRNTVLSVWSQPGWLWHVCPDQEQLFSWTAQEVGPDFTLCFWGRSGPLNTFSFSYAISMRAKVTK